MTIEGTKHRTSITDYVQRCKSCGRVFYFGRDCNGKWVRCPHCRTTH